MKIIAMILAFTAGLAVGGINGYLKGGRDTMDRLVLETRAFLDAELTSVLRSKKKETAEAQVEQQAAERRGGK